MSYLSLPKETGITAQDIHALFVYLQRSKDDFPDSVSTVTVDVSYSDEQAQDTIGHISTDTSTINVTYDDVTPKLTWDVKDNSSIQKIKVDSNDTLIAARDELNIQAVFNQFTINDDSLDDRINILLNYGYPRNIVTNTVIPNGNSVVVSRYLNVSSVLTLQGDGCLQVL